MYNVHSSIDRQPVTFYLFLCDMNFQRQHNHPYLENKTKRHLVTFQVDTWITGLWIAGLYLLASRVFITKDNTDTRVSAPESHHCKINDKRRTPQGLHSKHLYDICTMLNQRRGRWTELYKCYINDLCLLG